jgi:hypothetical protein
MFVRSRINAVTEVPLAQTIVIGIVVTITTMAGGIRA